MDKIEIELNDSKYTLEFNRYALIAMEKRGFNPSVAESKPLTTLIELSRGAFIMHHPELKAEEIDNIIDEIPNKVEFTNALAEMYKNAIDSLVNGKSDKKGNAIWGRA